MPVEFRPKAWAPINPRNDWGPFFGSFIRMVPAAEPPVVARRRRAVQGSRVRRAARRRPRRCPNRAARTRVGFSRSWFPARRDLFGEPVDRLFYVERFSDLAKRIADHIEIASPIVTELIEGTFDAIESLR